MSSLSARRPSSRQPSGSSTAHAAAPSTLEVPASSTSAQPGASTAASTNTALQLHKLIWNATIPLAITIDAAEAPDGVLIDKAVETYYARAPRISYLPLVLERVKEDLLSLMTANDDVLQLIAPDSCWFTYEGQPLRWHWPIGLLYDFHTSNTAPTAHGTPRGGSMSSSHSPWQLCLRIGKAPPADKMHSAPGLHHCRSSFMSMIKEADFVRHGSTKRVTNLRKAEQDALWDGVVEHDFDKYWSIASKLAPKTAPPTSQSATPTMPGSLSPSRAASLASNDHDSSATDRQARTSSLSTPRPSLTHQVNESQSSLHSAAASESGISIADSTLNQGHAGKGGSGTSAINYRSIPMRFHLPQGAPVVQEPVAPFTDDGRPVTLHAVLSALFPLLFPPTSSFASSLTATAPVPLAFAVIQGIRVPLDADVPWIGASLPSADGWVSVCVHLLEEGEAV